MPIYEYGCKECGDQVEVRQGINDRPLRKCQKCGGKLERLISATSFHLKGGGWYKDGYSTKKEDTKKTEKNPTAKKDDKKATKKTPEKSAKVNA